MKSYENLSSAINVYKMISLGGVSSILLTFEVFIWTLIENKILDFWNFIQVFPLTKI